MITIWTENQLVYQWAFVTDGTINEFGVLANTRTLCYESNNLNLYVKSIFMRKLSDEESKELEDALAQNGLAFATEEEAETFFFTQRDKDLEDIAKLNVSFPQLDLNLKATSLQRFENFYFQCYVDKTQSIDISKERMEELLTQYIRQVFVSNEMAEWMVFENDFAEGRYELGLMYGYGSGTMEHYAQGLDKREDNVKRTYLFDNFMMYVPEERENDIL